MALQATRLRHGIAGDTAETWHCWDMALLATWHCFDKWDMALLATWHVFLHARRVVTIEQDDFSSFF